MVSVSAAAPVTATVGVGVAGPSNGPGTSSRAMSVSSGSSDRSESQTVLERLKELECIMLEVLEKTNDPDAASESLFVSTVNSPLIYALWSLFKHPFLEPVIVRHEMGTSPHVAPKGTVQSVSN